MVNIFSIIFGVVWILIGLTIFFVPTMLTFWIRNYIESWTLQRSNVKIKNAKKYQKAVTIVCFIFGAILIIHGVFS